MRFVSVIIVVCVIVLSGFTAVKGGFKYTSDDNKISVTFPSEFETSIAETTEAPTSKATASKNEQVYMFTITKHTEELIEENLEQVALDAFVETLAGELVSKSEWKKKNVSGIKAVVNLPDQNANVEYLIFFQGNKQYQLVVVAAKSQWNQKGSDAFFKSIKFL